MKNQLNELRSLVKESRIERKTNEKSSPLEALVASNQKGTQEYFLLKLNVIESQLKNRTEKENQILIQKWDTYIQSEITKADYHYHTTHWEPVIKAIEKKVTPFRKLGIGKKTIHELDRRLHLAKEGINELKKKEHHQTDIRKQLDAFENIMKDNEQFIREVIQKYKVL